MLSLWKLRVGAEAYYLSQVARGLDDYYTGDGETEGRWFGTGAEHPQPARRRHRRRPSSDPRRARPPAPDSRRTARRSAPSRTGARIRPDVLGTEVGVGDVRIRRPDRPRRDRRSHRHAVEDAMAWLEREACFVRRGSNNRDPSTAPFEQWGTRRLPGAGFIAAGFRHRTSRAGDPQLHTHVLVANLTRGPDGRWSALDGQALYRSKLAAGVVFQTALRNETDPATRRRWRPVHDHVADIAGIPQKVLTHFSKRRNEIEGRTRTHGPDPDRGCSRRALSPPARRRSRSTRTPSTRRWRDDGATIGFGAEDIDRLV